MLLCNWSGPGAASLGPDQPLMQKEHGMPARVGNTYALKHGHNRRGRGSASSTYISWSNMVQRTTSPNHDSHAYYWDRGVTVTARWRDKDGFKNFLADMGERPEGMTLDRINPDGDYEPGNCRWATPKQQRANQRRIRSSDATL